MLALCTCMPCHVVMLVVLCTCVSVLVAVSCQLYACVATAVHNAAVIALRVEWRRA